MTRWILNRRLYTKILLVVVVLATVGAGVGAFAIVQMSQLSAAVHELYTGSIVPGQHLEKIAVDIGVMRSAVLKHALTTSDASKARYEQDIKAADATFQQDVQDYQKITADPALLNRLEAAWQRYRTARDTHFLPASKRHADVEQIRDSELDPAAKATMTHLNALIAAENAEAAAAAVEADHRYTTARTITISVLAVGLLLAGTFGLLVARGLARRVRALSGVIRAIADGDLTRSVDADSRDEIGQMAAELHRACGTLRTTVGQISGSSQTLTEYAQRMASASTQIAGTAEQTSDRAETVSAAAGQVSSNVDTVAAAVEEMTASIREIAGSATDAAGIAQNAVAVAQNANGTMSKLGASSAEIGDIVKVITSIAEQTNLLALNATIEAARAGEAGKGFAVVASEVKDLAQETAKATEEISSRIKVIQTDTSAAVTAIGEITHVIERINGYSNTIASAVEEQTATTSEIGRNVAEAATGAANITDTITVVAKAAQDTYLGVGETRQTANELSGLASKLQTLVGQFTV
ncbi:methyl-accepting chemotaxis protein [Actinoplanes digitatis]|uniref:Methyl-accepting chemotaxis protein n=1 Tax=Actinoplanes digitatis TaxID=1868 RepID=A0A7W7MPB7_9ACTN|nr:methyl-accepting chemotaxis protein [Actinoplanes digitatis]